MALGTRVMNASLFANTVVIQLSQTHTSCTYCQGSKAIAIPM